MVMPTPWSSTSHSSMAASGPMPNPSLQRTNPGYGHTPLFASGGDMLSYVFVYTLDHGRPRLLHRFGPGDRSHDGFVDVCIRNGTLIVVQETSRSCMACVEGITTTVWRWTKTGFTTLSKAYDKNQDPEMSQPLDYISACGRPAYGPRHGA